MHLLALLPLLPLALAQSAAVPTYAPCGGHRPDGPLECDAGFTCIDDPRGDGCGMACDEPGICVPDEGLETCGGFPGFECPDGLQCVDDPTDTCDPENGGWDCIGICV